MTGFISLESSLAEKWLELLKEIAPRVDRVFAMYNPDTAIDARDYYFPPLKVAASKLGVAMYPSVVRGDANIETEIKLLASKPGSGLIVMVDNHMTVHRKAVIASAARYKLPAIYPASHFVRDGGLIAYGVDVVDLFRRSAPYVDQILRGANTANLPVQQPTKFELAINRTAAKSLGLSIPQSLRIRADEIVE